MIQEKRKYSKFSLKDDPGMAWTPRNYSNMDHNLQYLTISIISFVLFLTPGNIIMIFGILVLIVDVGGISCFSPCLVSLRGSLSRHYLAEMCHFGIPIIRPISFLVVLNSVESLFVCDPFRKESPCLSQERYFAKPLTSSERFERPYVLQCGVYCFFAQDFLFKGA